MMFIPVITAIWLAGVGLNAFSYKSNKVPESL